MEVEFHEFFGGKFSTLCKSSGFSENFFRGSKMALDFWKTKMGEGQRIGIKNRRFLDKWQSLRFFARDLREKGRSSDFLRGNFGEGQTARIFGGGKKRRSDQNGNPIENCNVPTGSRVRLIAL
ncbi:MAG: hypothetical protein JWM68_4197 [Verrucomicrobiales bacterium]|nr:hypothetical protein [Verrucomicrobiales bacterium]